MIKEGNRQGVDEFFNKLYINSFYLEKEEEYFFSINCIYIINNYKKFEKEENDEKVKLYKIEEKEKIYLLLEKYEKSKMKWNCLLCFSNTKEDKKIIKEIYINEVNEKKCLIEDRRPILRIIEEKNEEIEIKNYTNEKKKQIKTVDEWDLGIHIADFYYSCKKTHFYAVKIYIEYNKLHYRFRCIFIKQECMFVFYQGIWYIIFDDESNKYKMDFYIYEDNLIRKEKYRNLKYFLIRILSSWEFGSKGNEFERYDDDEFLDLCELYGEFYTYDILKKMIK